MNDNRPESKTQLQADLTNPNPLLEAALQYASMGWYVVPNHNPGRNPKNPCSCGDPKCGSVGKHPHIRDWANQATTNEGVIKGWWERYPNANIGIATGEKSGIIILDSDGEEGEATLNQLQRENMPLLLTLVQKTGSGGKHFVFKWPRFC